MVLGWTGPPVFPTTLAARMRLTRPMAWTPPFRLAVGVGSVVFLFIASMAAVCGAGAISSTSIDARGGH